MTQADKIVQAIRDGHRFSKKMSAHTGIPQSNVYTLLSQLKGRGDIAGNGVTGYYTREEEEAKNGGVAAKPVAAVAADAPAVLARAVENALAEAGEEPPPDDFEDDPPPPASARLTKGHPWRSSLEFKGKKFTEPTQAELTLVCQALLDDKPEYGEMPRALLESITSVHGAAMAATLQALTEKGIVQETARGFEIADKAAAEALCGKSASYPANVAAATEEKEEAEPTTPASVAVQSGALIITSGEELDRIRQSSIVDMARRQQAKPAMEITDISSKELHDIASKPRDHNLPAQPFLPDPGFLPPEGFLTRELEHVPAPAPEKEWEWVKDSMTDMTINEHGALTLLCKHDKIELSVEETKRVFAFLCLCETLLEIPK